MLPYAAATTLAQGSGEEHDPTGAVVPPIHLATTFRRPPEGYSPTGWSYSRYGYPGLERPEATLKILEGAADCRLFSSGMSAMTAVVMALRPGDHCVFPIDMYHGLKTWLKAHSVHWGLRVEHVDMTDQDKVRAAVIAGATRLVWLETPSNPHWHIYDIANLAEIAHGAGARLVVDNTVATPILTQPIKLGADIVVHSATKYLNGHSDVLAGAVLTAAKDEFWERIVFNRDYHGGILGQFQSYLLMRGMRTLHLRVARSCESATALAEALGKHPKVKTVFYPGLPTHPGHFLAARQMTGGFGGMLSIVVAGGAAEANRVLTRTRIWQPATSLGGVESLIERREATEGPDSHVDPGLLRLSVGVEATSDLIDDLCAALGPTDPAPMREKPAPVPLDTQFRIAAETILNAGRQARAMPPLSGDHPQLDLDDAYRIQNLLMQARQRQGADFAGYKIGLTSRSVQLACGLTEPIHGRIIRDAVHDSGARLSASKFIKPHIEAELAFVIGRDLAKPDVSLDDVVAATEFVIPALEVVDHRMMSPRTVADTIADNSAFAAIVLSDRRFRTKDIGTAWIGATLSRSGVVEESGVSGTGIESPGACVAWLANALLRKGESLRKGDIVMAGAFARSIAVAAGDEIRADYGPLGTIDVSFR